MVIPIAELRKNGCCHLSIGSDSRGRVQITNSTQFATEANSSSTADPSSALAWHVIFGACQNYFVFQSQGHQTGTV
jgi:hypothetical protein